LTLPVAVIISGLAGFISLSYEILWFRALSFATGGRAWTFGILLGVFLLGLAMGARIAEKTVKAGAAPRPRDHLGGLGVRFLVANLVAFLAIPLMAATIKVGGGLLALEAIGLAAVGWGSGLPLLSEVAVGPDYRAGRKLSYIYGGNIVGSVTGTLVTGFVLLDVLSIRSVAVILGVSGLVLSLYLIYMSRPRGKRLWVISAGAVFGTLCIAASPSLFDRLYEKLLFKGLLPTSERFADVVENRSGVITVTPDREVFGSGAYDGWISTDLVADSNHIVRAYALAALRDKPREVLMIGLSTGAWAQVLAHMPGVENLTVVEINPGYLRLIAKYPEVASLRTNPRVDVVIDDGRRWLARHGDHRFDAIVMNTTFHWRAHVTNLLSREFLRLARANLRRGGILYFNTTSSDDVLKTAFVEFPYGMRFRNFVAVSDSPVHWNSQRFRSVLENYSIDEKKVFDVKREEDRVAFERVAAVGDQPESASWEGIESRERALPRLSGGVIVSDDNMVPEWESALIHRIGR
jgi:spermidine synthase